MSVNTLHLRVRDQVSQAHSTARKVMVLYILMFKFLHRRREDESFWFQYELQQVEVHKI
jgi:hypothetical protein